MQKTPFGLLILLQLMISSKYNAEHTMSVRKNAMLYPYLHCIITKIYCYHREEIMQTKLNQILMEGSVSSHLFDKMSFHRLFNNMNFKPVFKILVNSVNPNGKAPVGTNSFGFKLIGIIMSAYRQLLYWELNRFYITPCGHTDGCTAKTLAVYAREYTYTCKYIMIHICLTRERIISFILVEYNYTEPCIDHVPRKSREDYSPFGITPLYTRYP